MIYEILNYIEILLNEKYFPLISLIIKTFYSGLNKLKMFRNTSDLNKNDNNNKLFIINNNHIFLKKTRNINLIKKRNWNTREK